MLSVKGASVSTSTVKPLKQPIAGFEGCLNKISSTRCFWMAAMAAAVAPDKMDSVG